ncbi:MAG: hypothetical protein LBG05_00365, partial [Treponema sp.]|nr:hypothetical protein [Treponema sp.]
MKKRRIAAAGQPLRGCLRSLLRKRYALSPQTPGWAATVHNGMAAGECTGEHSRIPVPTDRTVEHIHKENSTMRTVMKKGLLCAVLAAMTTTAAFAQSGTSGSASGTSAFYSGGGGKGMSLAILAPKAHGLADTQTYIPALVQGEFVSNFTGY